jgi:transcriptional regulator with XRE-family HTH domain
MSRLASGVLLPALQVLMSVRKLRNAMNLTQEQFAARCAVAGFEIPRGTLAKIEAQIRGATDMEIFVIALVLRVPLAELFPPRLAQQIKRGEFARSL